MSKKSCLILTLVFLTTMFAQKISAQRDVPVPKIIDSANCDIRCKVLSYFTTHTLFTDCGKASFYVGFSVSAEGNVTDIRFSNGTSKNMQAFIKSALHSTDGKWTKQKANSEKKNCKTFLLPVAYSFRNKCESNRDTVIMINGEPFLAIPLYTDRFELNDFYSFLHMADFSVRKEDNGPQLVFPNKSNFGVLDCYLLSPVFLKRDR